MSAADEEMTWRAIVEYLELLGAILERRQRSVLIRWPPGKGDESWPIVIEHVEQFDEPWLVATRPLCPASEIDPRHALELNATLAIGEVATDGDVCVVRYSAPLAQLRPGDLERVLALLAWTPAAVLAEHPTERSESVFEQWT